jgi:hypothetical protein
LFCRVNALYADRRPQPESLFSSPLPGLAVLRRLGATERFGQGQLKLASAYQESGPGGVEPFDDVVNIQCNHSWPRGI